jgi:hypothetical protein
MVSFAHPDLLVNMTNDAWFGDSSEPWEHLALAQLRAVEHRRYLVRSTNSGVSAVVDPVGRVMVHGGTFDAEALDAIVHWMHPKTIYEVIGDSPWIVLSLALFAAAFVRRKGLPLAAAVLAAACSSSSPARPADAQADVHPRDATDDTTTADTASPTGDAGPCPVLAAVNFVSPICGACMAHRCCTASTPCYAITDADTVPDCALLADCVANCVEEDGAGVAGDAGDAGGADAGAVCRAHCQTQYGDGAGVLATMTACLEHQCTNDGGTGPCDY